MAKQLPVMRYPDVNFPKYSSIFLIWDEKQPEIIDQYEDPHVLVELFSQHEIKIFLSASPAYTTSVAMH